eukprot:263599_1
MSAVLSEKELERARLTFVQLDADSNGCIDMTELRHGLEAMGQRPSNKHLMDIMKSVDCDGNRTIDFGEFVRVIEIQTAHSRHISNEDEMHDAFVALGGTDDGSGTVSVQKIRDCIELFNLTLSVEDLMKEVNATGEELTYEQFSQIIITACFAVM